MATCSATENIFDTLRDKIDVLDYDDDELMEIANCVAINLNIQNQKFPKWV